MKIFDMKIKEKGDDNIFYKSERRMKICAMKVKGDETIFMKVKEPPGLPQHKLFLLTGESKTAIKTS